MKELIKCYCGHTTTIDIVPAWREGFVIGAKFQQERSYSEEDLKEAFQSGFTNGFNMNSVTFEQWFEQYKKK